MRNREVFKQAEQGMKRLLNQRRDLSVMEISQILDRYKNAVSLEKIIDLIASVYYFGVESGYRQAKSQHKKKS